MFDEWLDQLNQTTSDRKSKSDFSAINNANARSLRMDQALILVNRCAVRAPVFDLELPEGAKDFERIRFRLQGRFTAPTRQSPHVERESDQSTRERLSPTQQFSTNLGEEARFHECFPAFVVLAQNAHQRCGP